MEFHRLLLILSSVVVGILGGSEHFKRHLIHDATSPPEIGGSEGKCDYGFARHHDTIESPNFPNKYNNAMDCDYHIYAGEGNVIHINFWMISMEEHSHCNYDYLEIRNAQMEVVGKYCGSDLPEPINITDTAHLHFHSDFSNNKFGFQIEYFVSHSNCIFGEQEEGCVLPCKCETSAQNLLTCDRQTGQCVMGMCRHREVMDDVLADVWGGPACQIGNVAYNKAAFQVGTYNNMDATNAVDRRAGIDDQQKYCAHPDSKDKVNKVPAWWSVDLGDVYRVYNVTVYNTQDVGGAKRLEEFTVRYGDTEDVSSHQVCAKYKSQVEAGDHVTLACDVLTRYISIVREGGTEVTMMTLCEVVVVGHLYINVDCGRCTGVCAPEIYCDHCQTGYLAPSCRQTDSKITCPSPPKAPAYGYRVISGTSYGDTVTYECTPGFYVDGNNQLECDVNGAWTGQVPACERIRCGDPPSEPVSGYILVAGGTLFEDVVQYRCDSHYELEGAEEIRCEANGLWSDVAPTCRGDISCEDLPIIQHGVISPVNGTAYTSVAEYVCDGFLVRGSGFLTCTENGRWIPVGEASECSDCGGAIAAKDMSTMIGHPLITEKYKHSENCTWIIYADHPGSAVELSWFHMDIEPHVSCIHDSLTVYDSTGDRLHKISRFCGDELVSDITSLGHMIVLNFQSDDSVEMTGFKAEFKQVKESIDYGALCETFYPDLEAVLGIAEKESGLSSFLMYLLDKEIGKQEQTPTYVYLLQAIDAVSYLTETIFLPRLKDYFVEAFEHTLSHSLDTRVTDIEVAYKLYREVSEPITDLLGYLTVDFGDTVPDNERMSCFDQIHKLSEAAVAKEQTKGKTLALDILRVESSCVELIGQTDKRQFLDQMQSGPFEIYTGSMSAQSMYMLVKAYVKSAILDSLGKLENKLASIPEVVSSVISDPHVRTIYLEHLRLNLEVLTDTILFLNNIQVNFTDNAEQYLANFDLGWKLPQQDQYGRPVLHSLLDTLLNGVERRCVQAQFYKSFKDKLPLDTVLAEVKAGHLATLADDLVMLLDSSFEGDCGRTKMAALLQGFAEVKMLDVASSPVCSEETANSIGSEIDCDFVRAKALAFYRELLWDLGDAVDPLLGGSIHTETIPLGLAFLTVEDIVTLGDLVHHLIDVIVPRFQIDVPCDLALNMPKLAGAFETFLTRLNTVSDLAEDIAIEMMERVDGEFVYDDVYNQIKDILVKKFSRIINTLEPFASVSSYPEVLKAISKTSAQFLGHSLLDLKDEEEGPQQPPAMVDLGPVIDMIEKQDVALGEFVKKLADLKEDMIVAMAAQGVDICSAAPQLC